MMTPLARRVAEVSDGLLTREEVAALVGGSVGGVQKILSRHPEIPRPNCGARRGEKNQSWRGGRMVDLDGYVLLENTTRRLAEHRVVMERVLGRPLLAEEVVDHIDGITIHNDPTNLRVFASNAEHLRETISGRKRAWSKTGYQNIGARTDRGRKIEPVDTYHRRKARGDVRLRAILRAALELGIAHPCLLGTTHWLTQIGIDPASRPNLERAWAQLEHRYALDLH